MTEPEAPPPPLAQVEDPDAPATMSALDVPAAADAAPGPASDVAAPGDVPPSGPIAADPGPARPAPASDVAAPGPHPWSEPDRPRGLDAWFAPGGEDAATEERVGDERRLVWLMVVMVGLFVGVPTVLTLIAFVGQILALRGS